MRRPKSSRARLTRWRGRSAWPPPLMTASTRPLVPGSAIALRSALCLAFVKQPWPMPIGWWTGFASTSPRPAACSSIWPQSLRRDAASCQSSRRRPTGTEQDSPEVEEEPGVVPAVLLRLRSDPGRPSLANVQEELAKLELIRQLELSTDLFDHALPHELE